MWIMIGKVVYVIFMLLDLLIGSVALYTLFKEKKPSTLSVILAYMFIANFILLAGGLYIYDL